MVSWGIIKTLHNVVIMAPNPRQQVPENFRIPPPPTSFRTTPPQHVLTIRRLAATADSATASAPTPFV